MKARYLALLLVLLARVCLANMASPYVYGTKVSTAFSSSSIDILSEKIFVAIDSRFQTAAYTVEYSIKTDTGGMQTPLLFYAQNYKSDFKVWVDGVLINLLQIPENDAKAHSHRFKKFSDAFDNATDTTKAQQVTIYWDENWADTYPLSDLKYFEAKLSKGLHKIRVEYTADRWLRKHSWINEYSFKYALSPAKFWRSFGTLQINISASNFNNITTNLYKGADQVSGDTKTWNFTNLPGNTFEITYTPQLSGLASTLISIEPVGLAVILGLLLVFIHVIWVIKYRKLHPQNKYSVVVISGSLLLPALVIIAYLFSFSVIDSLLGDNASHYHGYIFLIIFIYPIITPFYWLALLLVDRTYKRKLIARGG